jgi:ABC-type antimicrobial peptide transport system permease subunit
MPIAAPIDGEIIARNVEPGQMVSASDKLFVMADVLIQLLTEALVISMVGGTFGIILGWLINLGVANLAGWTSIVTLSSIIIAVSFSVVIGIVFGIWPARKASLLNPIDALRYE